MAAITDILQNFSRQRGRNESGPLLATRILDAQVGSRISHLAINQRLERAWIELTGEPFRQHQALALSALRRGEPFALVGGGPTARQTLLLLVCELLHNEAHATTLLLCPDHATATILRQELERINSALDLPIGVVLAGAEDPRSALHARIVVATPQSLHERLLRHHDRAWRWLWAGLRLIATTDLQHYSGIGAAHLAALLLRANRLAGNGGSPLLVATLAEVGGADAVLTALTGQSWRLIAVDDGPRERLTVAYWRGGVERLRESALVALHLSHEKLSVHIHCDESETSLLNPLVDSDSAKISVGPFESAAQVLVFAGFPPSPAALRQALERNARAVILVLGDAPLERTIARLISQGGEGVPALSDQQLTWIAPPINAYVAAQHLLCAANERPLTIDELQTWNAEAIVARLEQHQQLGRLPEVKATWQPLPNGAHDPYANFDLRAAGSAAATLDDERGLLIDRLDPAAYDRWGFIGATLPVSRGSYRVIGRDEEAFGITLRANPNACRSFPLRRCTAQLRDERERRSLRGRLIGLGRVTIEEEIYGYREAAAGVAPAERALTPPLSTTWSAPALWIELPGDLQAQGQLIGWSLVTAVPLRAIGAISDLVPVFAAAERRLYIVEAQPGGNGAATWLFRTLDELLPLAYDIALDCRSDPLFEPLARADMDWLLQLLGGDVVVDLRPTMREQRPPSRDQPAPSTAPLPRRAAEPPPIVRESRAVPGLPPLHDPPIIERAARPAPEPLRREPPAPPEPPRAPEPPRRESPAPPEPPRAPEPTRPVDRAVVPKAASQGARSSSRKPAGPDRHAKRQHNPPAPRVVPTSPPPILPPERSLQPPDQVVRPAQASPTSASPELPPGADAPIPNAAAMVARLRRLREERELREPSPQLTLPLRESEPIEPRFVTGDRIFCVPYGEGVVRASSIVADKELLTVAFPEHGELMIDPSISAVRKIEGPQAEEE